MEILLQNLNSNQLLSYCENYNILKVEGGRRKKHSRDRIIHYRFHKKGLDCAHEAVVNFLHTHPKMIMWLTKFENNRVMAYDTWEHCKKLGPEEENCYENWKISIAEVLNQLDEEATTYDPTNQDEHFTQQLMTAIDLCFPESKLKLTDSVTQ